MSRPKGSKNKPKIVNGEIPEPLAKINSEGSIGNFAIKRGRGRPKGSLGKTTTQPINETAIPLDVREVKRRIRLLRKIKKDTHKKTAERRELNEKIRELKKTLLPIIQDVEPEKTAIINEIYERKPILKTIDINMTKFTIEQLQKHLNRIKNGETII